MAYSLKKIDLFIKKIGLFIKKNDLFIKKNDLFIKKMTYSLKKLLNTPKVNFLSTALSNWMDLPPSSLHEFLQHKTHTRQFGAPSLLSKLSVSPIMKPLHILHQ